MAAGLGFKDFVTGEVLTAADVDGYLMQGVWVFASAAARDAAVTSPQEGNFAYLKDTNVTTYYTGSAWANLDTTGMTNPMTTTGDTIYSSSGSTPARLGIGTTGQVLTVAGGVPSWATPAGGGGKVLQVVQGTLATSASTTSGTLSDTGLTASITPSSATSKVLVMITMPIYASKSATVYPLISYVKVLRGATALSNTWEYPEFSVGGNVSKEMEAVFAFTYLDSPSTTSSTTYKTQFAAYNSGTTFVCFQNTTATIVLMEIGA